MNEIFNELNNPNGVTEDQTPQGRLDNQGKAQKRIQARTSAEPSSP